MNQATLLRITKEFLDAYNYGNERRIYIVEMFPWCATTNQKGLWACYRPGKVIVSKIKVGLENSSERTIPTTIMAQEEAHIYDLCDFLCVCESLFQRIEATEKFELLRKSVMVYPDLLSGRRAR